MLPNGWLLEPSIFDFMGGGGGGGVSLSWGQKGMQINWTQVEHKRFQDENFHF